MTESAAGWQTVGWNGWEAWLMTCPVWLYVAASVIIGAIIGSFLNVVIYRLPIIREAEWSGNPSPVNLAFPASHCPICRAPVKWFHNIPVISFFILRGRCASCGEPIAWQYPAVEAVTGILFGITAWHFGAGFATLSVWIYVSFMVALSALDFKFHWLPDDLTLLLLWCGLFVNLYDEFVPLNQAVIGAMAGYLVLWAVYWGCRILFTKEGMGHGDFKTLAAVGAFCGWQSLPTVLLIASLLGLLYAAAFIVKKKQNIKDPIPFGPALLTGGFAWLLGADTWISAWIMQSIG